MNKKASNRILVGALSRRHVGGPALDANPTAGNRLKKSDMKPTSVAFSDTKRR